MKTMYIRITLKIKKVVEVKKVFTFCGESFAIHRPFNGEKFLQHKWCVSHIKTGYGSGVCEDTQIRAEEAFKKKFNKYIPPRFKGNRISAMKHLLRHLDEIN